MKVLEQGVLCHSEERDVRSCGHFQHVNVSRYHAKNLTIELTAVNIANESTPVRGKPGVHVSTECGLLLLYIIFVLCYSKSVYDHASITDSVHYG